ncbi:hypothetical protein SAY87_011018 [Trapa incisa]|uniref:RING-type E3 ubiquitin transferase n=1 Tax=Trapa incisa TaxID=236973 RepID=A0AAN7GIP4_9MYRT|nr:hypothetical protein SAY87_011018 [Trapa incisa]
MGFLTVLMHHEILLLSITRRLAEAQQPSMPPDRSPDLGGLNFSASSLGAVVAVAALTSAVYSLYIVHCARAIGWGYSRSGWARRASALPGLDPTVVNSFPVLEYAVVKGLRLGKGALECAVCLNEFEDHEALRLLTKCDHVFHPDCIDPWLSSHTTCPVCRTKLDPESGGLALPAESPPVGAMRSVQPPLSVQVAVVADDRNREVELVYDEQELATCPGSTPRQNWSDKQWSVRTSRFSRSHSTGHSLVNPGQDNERFTLRLPADLRKQVIGRAAAAAGAPSSSSRKGNYTTGEGSSQGRSYFRLPQVLDRAFASDRWVFNRMSSIFVQFTPTASPGVPGPSFHEGVSMGRSSRANKEAAPSAPVRSPALEQQLGSMPSSSWPEDSLSSCLEETLLLCYVLAFGKIKEGGGSGEW